MMLFRLADRLQKTVAEIERDCTYREITEWFAYFKIIETKT